MKRLKRITATEESFNINIQLTPDDVHNLLLQIEELKNCKIETIPFSDGTVEFIIGKSTYHLKNEDEEMTYM